MPHTDEGTPIRVGLEASWDPGWPAGLLYVRNLVYTLAALPEDRRPRVVLLPVNQQSQEMIKDLDDYPFVRIAAGAKRMTETSLKFRRIKRRYIQPFLGRVIDDAYRDLDVTYPAWGKPLPGVPQMRWIPDLQHVHLPHLFSPQQLEKRTERFAKMAAEPGVIVFSSRAARDDFTRLYPNSRATLRVWRFCSSITDVEKGAGDPRPTFDLPEFYLYVGNQFWAHKEHLTLFESLLILRDNGLEPTVICTGLLKDDRNPGYIDQVVRFIEDRGLQTQVKLLGMVERKQQIAIVRHAAGVVQPSRFEGWSTLIEDARVLGRPVIASDIAVHREQVPDATFFPVGSAEGLAEALARVLPTLSPGPDAEAERAADADNKNRRIDLANRFVEIARSAIGRTPS